MVITRVREGENALIYLILKALLELNLTYTGKQHKYVSRIQQLNFSIVSLYVEWQFVIMDLDL